MKVISSQRHLNYTIVEEKIAELTSKTSVELPVYEVGFDDLYILCDGHHTKAAAEELGIEVIYKVIEHQDRLTGEELLEISWIDSDWYDVETGSLIFA